MIFRFLALLVLPFLFVPILAEQRELPRHVLVQLSAFGALAWVIFAGKLRLSWWPVVFACWLLIATAAAESPLRSLYGPYEGHTGALAFLAYLVLLLLPLRREYLPHLAALLACSGTIQAGLGAYQLATEQAMVGTIGHVAFLAPFLALGAVAALGLASIARHRALLAAWLASAIFQASLLAMSGRRGALLALIAGALVMIGFAQAPVRRRLLIFAAALAVVIVLSVLKPSGPAYEPRAIDRWSGLLGEAPVPKNIDTVGQREDFYRVALRVAAEKPLLGWGFGAFRDHYARYKNAEVSRFETREHNIFLELAVAAGWPAAILFFVLIAALARSAVKQILAAEHEPRAMIATAAAIVAAYGVHLCFSFDQPALGAWAFTFAGFFAASSPIKLSLRWKVLALAPVAIAVFASAVRPLADYHMARGLELERAGRALEAIAAYESGVRAAPHECLFALKLAAILNATSTPSESRPKRIELMSRCAKQEPRNAFVHYHLGLALAPVSEPTTVLERAEALHHLALATTLAPEAGVFHQGLAQALATFGDPTAALTAIDRALALDPENPAYLHDRENIRAILARTGARR